MAGAPHRYDGVASVVIPAPAVIPVKTGIQ